MTSPLEDLAEHKELDQVIGGQGNGTANSTEYVRASTLVERLDALLSDNLATSVDGRMVLDGLEHAGQCSKALSGNL